MPWRALRTLAVLWLLPIPQLFAGNSVTPGVELVTYFRTQLPPEAGKPVCLIGGTTPIGMIKSVDLVPHHDEYYEAWKVEMEINKSEALGITTDSVADADPSGPCGVLINVYGNGPPIAYRTVIAGEVTYLAEIVRPLPRRPWWSAIAGIVWLEAVCVLMGALVTGGGLVLHSRLKRGQQPSKS